MMKNIVGTFEAKTNFNKIIQRVNEGEEFLITRRGHLIARISPLKEPSNDAVIKAAIKRVKVLRQEMNLRGFNWEEWKLYKEEGRK